MHKTQGCIPGIAKLDGELTKSFNKTKQNIIEIKVNNLDKQKNGVQKKHPQVVISPKILKLIIDFCAVFLFFLIHGEELQDMQMKLSSYWKNFEPNEIRNKYELMKYMVDKCVQSSFSRKCRTVTLGCKTKQTGHKHAIFREILRHQTALKVENKITEDTTKWTGATCSWIR